MAGLAPLIAVIGCDGSGKSTLAEDLHAHFSKVRPTERAYLGLKSGAMGQAIKQWPLIGPWFEGQLSQRAEKARDTKEKIPGLATALVIYGFSLIRKRRFKRVLALRQAGTMVITDRYPQIEVPGFYDGPGLSAARPDSWLVAKLAARERAVYDWMASFVPTHVIRLNIDVETALQRKPDHARALIEKKVAATPKLTFNDAPITDLDARMDYGEEVKAAIAAVDAALAG